MKAGRPVEDRPVFNGDLARTLRRRAGISAVVMGRKVASAAGLRLPISQSSILAWERCMYRPSYRVVEAIAKVLDVAPYKLITEKTP